MSYGSSLRWWSDADLWGITLSMFRLHPGAERQKKLLTQATWAPLLIQIVHNSLVLFSSFCLLSNQRLWSSKFDVASFNAVATCVTGCKRTDTQTLHLCLVLRYCCSHSGHYDSRAETIESSPKFRLHFELRNSNFQKFGYEPQKLFRYLQASFAWKIANNLAIDLYQIRTNW